MILFVLLPDNEHGAGIAKEVTYITGIPHFHNYDGSYTPLVDKDLRNAGIVEVNGKREYVDLLMQAEANLFLGECHE